ncbi:hypothetical protein [Mycobacterium sp. URHB0044]|uniref:DUF7159 family protein n=1 Tax=Mycobacterium sp. URHB0044 TaxID=1380386 RepID=UPI00048AB471|nr:hypothetical protein [Mycobacterium sp. URHB0044]
MNIVLGVSMTPKTVRMVLVEGEKGDGAIVDHDTFDVSSSDGTATSTAAVDQVVAAILGTQESAAEGGHVLNAIGVTWSDHVEAAALRDSMAAHGIKDVMLVSELHAAGALAQAAGRAVGYDSTALLFIDRDTATLSVVRSDDGSIVKVLSRSLHSTDAMAVLADMVAAVEAQDSAPQGMFVVGSGVDIASVKSHLADLVAIPVNAPDESGLALARGAALAAATAPAFDATTAGLAYALDPDGATAGNESVGLANAETQMRPSGPAAVAWAEDPDPITDLDFDGAVLPAEEGRKPFLLVGSALTSIFVIGVVALVISLAVNIRPTADQRPDAGRAAIAPSAVAPPPAPAIEQAQPAVAPPPPPAETIKAPIPVVQEAPAAPPRTVYVEPPAAAPAPIPEAPAPAPAAPPPPPPAAPVIPAPVILPPPVVFPPIWQPPQQQRPQWRPPWQQWPRQHDDDDWPQAPQYPQYPQQPQYPQYPQQPQYPQYPQPQQPQPQQPQLPWPPSQSGGSGSDGSGGNGGSNGSRGGSGGSHDSPGNGGQGNCFLIFCSGPTGGH